MKRIMRLRRQQKIFISYNRNDEDILKPLITKLEEAKFEILIDRESIRSGDNIPMLLMDMIKNADCVLCLGTRSSLESKWCKQEVEYAREMAIPYIPILTDSSLSLPGWFVHRRSGIVHYFLWTVAGDNNALIDDIRALIPHAPVTMLSASLMLVFLLLLIPMLLAGLVRPHLFMAHDPVPYMQEWIERINVRMQASDPLSALERERLIGQCGSQRDDLTLTYSAYLDNETSILVCDEYMSKKLIKRVYKQNGSLVASEDFHWSERSNGNPSFVKYRTITPHREQEIQIEEAFDSVGNLISKRVISKQDGTWQAYNDVGRSVFPIFMLMYR